MTEAVGRRSFLMLGLKAAGVAVVGGGVSVLSGCDTGSSNGSRSASGTQAGVSTAPAQRGGKVVMGTGSEIDGFDPTKNRWDTTGNLYARTVYDTLAAYAADGTVRPYLAQSIEPNPDFTRWTIRLRPGVAFHNGTPLTADAVKANLDGLRTSFLSGPALTTIASVDVADPMTVVVSMKGPWVPFPTYLTGQAGVVVEPRNLLGGSAQHSPVGTGPFKFQDWVPGSQFVATRNSQYWRSGFPYLDQLEFRPITDPQSLENSLKSGSIDMLSTADTQTLANLHGDSAFVTIDDLHSMVGEPDMAFLMCNTAVAPVDDIRVRQALAYALDKQKLIDILGNGILPQSFGPFVSGSPYYGPTGYPGFDLGKARALIADYEREKGKVSFELGTLASPRTLQISQVVQAMWKQAGADCRIGTLENSQFILNALNGKYQVNTWLQFAAPDPDANYIWWSSTTAGPVGQLSLNFARNKDPLIQQALDTGRMTPDPAVRAAAYKTVARRFGEDLPYLWVARGLSLVSARRGVMNFAGPTLPDGGTALALLNGVIWPTQIWRQT